MSESDKETIETAVKEGIEWLDSNPEAEADEYKEQKKAIEEAVNPIISKLYGSEGGAPPPEGGAEEDEGEL